MKKLFIPLSFFILAVFASCEKGLAPDAYRASDSQKPNSVYRTSEEVLDIAQHSLKLLDGHPTRSGIMVRELDLKNGIGVFTDKATRSLSLHGIDTLMYVVNFKNNAGFAMISARRDLPPLLAVTEDGSLVNGKSSGMMRLMLIFKLY